MKLSGSHTYIIVDPESEWKRFRLKCSRAFKRTLNLTRYRIGAYFELIELLNTILHGSITENHILSNCFRLKSERSFSPDESFGTSTSNKKKTGRRNNLGMNPEGLDFSFKRRQEDDFVNVITEHILAPQKDHRTIDYTYPLTQAIASLSGGHSHRGIHQWQSRNLSAYLQVRTSVVYLAPASDLCRHLA